MNNNYIGVDLDLFRQPKIQRLELKLGKSGVGLYLQIYLKLAETGNALLEEDLPILEREFFIKQETLKQVIYEFDLFTIKNGTIYSTIIADKLSAIKKVQVDKSRAGKLGALKRWSSRENDNTAIDTANSTAIDLPLTENSNKRKEKKIKEKESKLNNKEIINNFFETENLIELVQKKFVQLDNQVWFEEQANNSLELMKENMLVYYEKKQIKNMKSTFNNWLANCKRTDFYKYLDQKSTPKESPIEREYSKKLEETYRNDRGEELASERIERENREYQEKLKAMTPEEKEKHLKEKQDAKDQLFAMMSKLKNKSIY
jgi:hypothetical protein